MEDCFLRASLSEGGNPPGHDGEWAYAESADLWVSQDGRVWRAGDERFLKPSVSTQSGHLKVCGKWWLHRLVYEAFIGPIENGKIVRHLDGNPMNNSPENLKLGTQSDNWHDSDRHGTSNRGARNYKAALTANQVIEVRERLARGERGSDIARDLGVTHSVISHLKMGVTYANR